MAVIQHKIRNEFVQEIEFTLLEIKRVFPANWVNAKMTFRFWSGFPEISIERNGQLTEDVYSLIEALRSLVSGKVKEFTFYPTEPDYEFSATGDSDSFLVKVVFDATGTQRTGVYCGFGPTLAIPISKKDLETFSNDLESEMKKLESEAPAESKRS